MQERKDEFTSGIVELIPQLRRRAIGLCRDGTAADDLVQDTVVRALQNRRRFRAGTNLAAWTMTILRNCFLSDMRRARRARDARERIPREAHSVPGNQEDSLRLHRLAQDIAGLPAAQRRPLLMVSVGDASYAETAARCGCSVGTIKSRVSRARQRLAELDEAA